MHLHANRSLCSKCSRLDLRFVCLRTVSKRKTNCDFSEPCPTARMQYMHSRSYPGASGQVNGFLELCHWVLSIPANTTSFTASKWSLTMLLESVDTNSFSWLLHCACWSSIWDSTASCSRVTGCFQDCQHHWACNVWQSARAEQHFPHDHRLLMGQAGLTLICSHDRCLAGLASSPKHAAQSYNKCIVPVWLLEQLHNAQVGCYVLHVRDESNMPAPKQHRPARCLLQCSPGQLRSQQPGTIA